MAETAVDLPARKERENLPELVCLPVRHESGGTTSDAPADAVPGGLR